MSDDPYAWPGLDRTESIKGHSVRGGWKDEIIQMPDGDIDPDDISFDKNTPILLPQAESVIDALEPGLYLKCAGCDAFTPLSWKMPANVGTATATWSDGGWLCERCA